MWLIADSGSTKTEWILFNSEGVIKQKITLGLNPLFLTEGQFTATLRESIPKSWADEVTKLWFYSAGCGSIQLKEETTNWLASFFGGAVIEVDSDLLAAARATCGNEEGVVAIMGTGSNSCLYDGRDIKNHIKPLGYILGDEGSGVALGKALLKKLLRNQLSEKLAGLIYDEIGLDYEGIIKEVYQKPNSNRFIASCSKALYVYQEEPEIEEIIKHELSLFVLLLMQYNSELNLHFVGSIAFYFQEKLKEIANQKGLNVGAVLKSPAEALVSFHLEKKPS